MSHRDKAHKRSGHSRKSSRRDLIVETPSRADTPASARLSHGRQAQRQTTPSPLYDDDLELQPPRSPCSNSTDSREHSDAGISDQEQEYTDQDGDDSSASGERGCDILYRLKLSEGKKDTMRYSRTPFKGLKPDDREVRERQGLSVIDILDEVEGKYVKKVAPKHQLRKTFLKHKQDHDEFNLENDFIVQVTHHTMVRIHSTCLISVLRSLILYYPSLDLQKQEITISYPFKPFFYYWDDLQKILNGERTHETTATINMPDTGTKISIPCTTETYKHLNILLQAPPIQEVYRERVVPEIELHSRGLATFAQLWLLFKPGEIVFSRVRGELAGFVVQRITINSSKYSHDTPHPAARWKLVLWNLVYGNRKLRRQRHTVYINSFHGEKRISDMAAYPVKWAENQEELSAELIKRGKRYYDIICEEQSHMRYNGQVIAKKPYHYQGEIIVDHQSYKLEVSSSSSMEMLDISGEEPQDLRGEPLFSKFNDMECSPGNRLQRAQYLLLPAYVLGFALGKREWAIFDMSFVEPLEVDKNDPMKNVIIDRSKRNLIEAAAGFRRKKHGVEPWDTDWTADFVEGKGRGRVVFLHGPPGTGKTMTVECIAKKTNRPLMRISAADLGMKEVEMEGRLVKWLDRATRWGAVMLIDEAEVYLEQRKTGNINQNALVTAFLRTMEYFPGLLFLTSNSIGLFDEAVMSRIHLAIRYDRPTDAQRKMIWTSLFKKLDKDQPSENSGKDDASTSKTTGRSKHDAKPRIRIPSSTRKVVLSKDIYPANLQLNGRDIRNILLGAISMAVFQAQRDGKCPDVVEVTKEHLKEVLKNKEEFNEDYKHATGFYPDERAAEDFRRPGGDADKDE